MGYLEANQKSVQEPANTGFKFQPHHAWVTNYNASICVNLQTISMKEKKVRRTDFMFYVWDETAKQEKQEQSAYSFKVG